MHSANLFKAFEILYERKSKLVLYRQQTPGWNMKALVDTSLG